MDDASTPFAAVRESMRRFVAERAWEKYHTPRNLAASVSIEAGELLELFQWLTPDEAAARCRDDAAFRQAVADEMADVMLYLASLANATGIDLTAAVESKLERVQRKYPPEQFHGRYERPVG